MRTRPGIGWLPIAVALLVGLAPFGLARAARLPALPLARADVRADVSLGTAGLTAPGEPAAASPPARDPEPATTATTPPPDDAPRRTLVRARGVPPFWIDREYTTHRTRAVAFPPLFIDRRPKEGHPERFLHADLSFTFGWYSKSRQRKRWLNPFAIVFGGFSERKTVWGVGPLLMGYRRVGEQFNFGQFPLVWWWGTKFVKNFLFVPFHYQQKAPDGFMGVSALLFWYGHKNQHDADISNDRSHFVAAPVFWRFRKGLGRFDFAFLYMGGENKLRGTRWLAVPPFAAWTSREFGNRKELWTLPWVQRSDAARKRSAWAVPLLLTFSDASPKRRILSATPLVWRHEDRLRDRRLTLVGLVGVLDDPQQRNVAVAPLFFRFTDKRTRSTTQWLLPLFVSRTSPERTAVWTLLGGGRKSTHDSAFAIPWLLSYGVFRDDGTRLATLAGLFWHARSRATDDTPARSTWVLGPLAFSDRRGEMRHFGVPPLLTFAGSDRAGRHYQVVTPLLWHVRDRARDTRTVVTGPFYHHRERDRFDGGLVPLVFWGGGKDRRYGIVPWLLTADVRTGPRHLTLSPLFVQSRGPDHRAVGVLGLGWDVLRDNERHTGVFPIFYRRRIGNKTLVLTLLGGRYEHERASTTVIGPFVRRRSKTHDGWGVLPILYHDDHPVAGGRAVHTILVPLFLRRRTPNDDVDMWTPLVWRREVRGDRPRRGLAVVPLYFRQRQPNGVDVDAGLGFFAARNARRHTHTVIAGPAFHLLSRKSLNAGVVPLYWWRDSVEKRRLLALPAIFHFADKVRDEHTTVAVPFWFDRKRANATRTWSAFPFVIGTRKLYNFTRVSLVPLGYFDVFRLQRNARFTGFVPLLFRYQKCGFVEGDDAACQYTLWGSAPLFLYGRDGRGRLTHGALLYYYDRDPTGYRLFTPLFGIHNKPGRVLGGYAGPIAWKVTNTHRSALVFPLFYRRAHRLENTSVTLALPPLFIARKRKDRSFFEAGLVVWQFRQQHKVSTAILPPLFFYSDAYAERRLYWLLPFFIRDNQMGKDNAWFAIPGLYTQRRHGKDLDFVLFPLVWHIERGRNQGTFGAGLWWDVRARETTFQTVPGVFFRVVRRHVDTKVVGPGLAWWSRGSGPEEGNHGWRILFGAFGGGVDDGRRYVSVFGARIDRGPAVERGGKPTAKAERRRRRADRKAARAARREERRLAAAGS